MRCGKVPVIVGRVLRLATWFTLARLTFAAHVGHAQAPWAEITTDVTGVTASWKVKGLVGGER